MIGSVRVERDNSENAPWEFVAAVGIMRFQDSNSSPQHHGPEMALRSKQKHPDKRRIVVGNQKLYRMAILAANTDWLQEFVMLLMEPLVQRQSFVFAVKQSVCHMETKVFTDDADKELSRNF